MAETSDELALVERICGLLHAAHCDHLLIHFEEAIFGHLYFERRGIGFKGSERIFMKLD
jgi:hypothetical protein